MEHLSCERYFFNFCEQSKGQVIAPVPRQNIFTAYKS